MSRPRPSWAGLNSDLILETTHKCNGCAKVLAPLQQQNFIRGLNRARMCEILAAPTRTTVSTTLGQGNPFLPNQVGRWNAQGGVVSARPGLAGRNSHRTRYRKVFFSVFVILLGDQEGRSSEILAASTRTTVSATTRLGYLFYPIR